MIYLRLQQVPDALLSGILDYESKRYPASLRDSGTASVAITAADLPEEKKKDLHMQCRSSHRMSYRKWRLAMVFEVPE